MSRRTVDSGGKVIRLTIKLLIGGVERVSFLAMIITLFVGMLIFVSGVITKKKWLMYISIVPLVIALSQIVLLFSMSLY